jgi:hypothetical protein
MTSEALACCCGEVSCCPFTSVTWQASASSIRFTNLNASNAVELYKAKTVLSVNSQTNDGQLSTLEIRPEYRAAQVLPRIVTTGINIPTCMYKKSVATPNGLLNGAIVVRRIEADPSSGNLIEVNYAGGFTSCIYVAQAWSFAGGGRCWEAGIVATGTLQPPFIFGGMPTRAIQMGFFARANIIPSGCPTSLLYNTGQFSTGFQWAGTIRHPPFGQFGANQGQRVGFIDGSAQSLANTQYAIASSFVALTVT